jgi:hypothetical protein
MPAPVVAARKRPYRRPMPPRATGVRSAPPDSAAATARQRASRPLSSPGVSACTWSSTPRCSLLPRQRWARSRGRHGQRRAPQCGRERRHPSGRRRRPGRDHGLSPPRHLTTPAPRGHPMPDAVVALVSSRRTNPWSSTPPLSPGASLSSRPRVGRRAGVWHACAAAAACSAGTSAASPTPVAPIGRRLPLPVRRASCARSRGLPLLGPTPRWLRVPARPHGRPVRAAVPRMTRRWLARDDPANS